MTTLTDKYARFVADIRGFVDANRIYTDELRRIAWGTDASCYRITPQVVIRSKNEAEVAHLLQKAAQYHLPVTFRAAGTSLSGQSISDSILIVAGKNWEEYSIQDNGQTITMQPGLIGKKINEVLKPFGRYFAPDPASIGSCMVGGIIINNSSGMSCGIHANSDQEIVSLRMVLADGTILDTANEESKQQFREKHPEILDEIGKISQEIVGNISLKERVHYKYSIKNVTGLNLYPFVRFTDPFEILTHLMVGSEGTLGFLSQVTMRTREIQPCRACAMVYFKDIKEAARAVVALRQNNVTAAELLDSRSLCAAHDKTGKNLTALLTETRASSEQDLQKNVDEIEETLRNFDTFAPVHFTTDEKEYSKYWSIRSGIFPAVGGMRAEGTTCIIEDIAFHIEDLPQATQDLSDLLTEHNYTDSCIYGHALEGNFHFIINQSFNNQEQITRYEKLINAVAEMVVNKYDGSLKAEHGTGRNMAPFVRYEWGEELYAFMKRIKRVFDPQNLLNPSVIFNEDAKCHLQNLKQLPIILPQQATALANQTYQQINKCIECGFCEVNCVSCGFTLSSRTRIVLNREIALRRQQALDYKTLLKSYKYLGEETCAADGLCSMSCPMGINVADLTHELRSQQLSLAQKSVWQFIANHYAGFKQGVRAMLYLASGAHFVLRDKCMSAVATFFHTYLKLPLWTISSPKPYCFKGKSAIKSAISNQSVPLKVVYLPSCLNQMMGLPKETSAQQALMEETIELLHKAGCDVILPENREKLCCGTVWESKGMADIARQKVEEVEKNLWELSVGGTYPILCDQSPCLHQLRKHIKRLKLYEPAEFIWTYLRERLEWHQSDKPVAVHVTCSTKLMGVDKILIDLAQLCSSRVFIPEGVGCCAYAGDKGMTHPELNQWATRKLRKQIQENSIISGYSNSRTCEIGLQQYSGVPYMSIVYLVNECTSAKHENNNNLS